MECPSRADGESSEVRLQHSWSSEAPGWAVWNLGTKCYQCIIGCTGRAGFPIQIRFESQIAAHEWSPQHQRFEREAFEPQGRRSRSRSREATQEQLSSQELGEWKARLDEREQDIERREIDVRKRECELPLREADIARREAKQAKRDSSRAKPLQ